MVYNVLLRKLVDLMKRSIHMHDRAAVISE